MAPRPRPQRHLDFGEALASRFRGQLCWPASRADLRKRGQLGLCLHQVLQKDRPDQLSDLLPFTRAEGPQHPWLTFPLLNSLFPGFLGVVLGPDQEPPHLCSMCVGVAAVNSSLLGHDGLLPPLIRGC